MDLFSYIKWNEINDNAIIKDFMISDNRAKSISLVKYDKYSTTIPYHIDIMNEIKISIWKNNDFDLEIIDCIILDLKILLNGKIIYKIEKHNIVYSSNDIIIIKFSLKNSIYYNGKNIGGLPFFLLKDSRPQINIIFKNNNDGYTKKFIKEIAFSIGGINVLPSFIKLTQKLHNYQLPNLINETDILKNLVFSNSNEKDLYEIENNILNFLNVLMYKKEMISSNKIMFELYLEKETKYIVIKINKKLDEKTILSIRCDGYDYFYDNICLLYNNGYYIYEFNSKLLCMNDNFKLIFDSIEITEGEFNNDYLFEFFNVYD
jgi:hypothetical protein